MKKLVVTVAVLIAGACIFTACESSTGSAVSTETTVAGGATTSVSSTTDQSSPLASLVAISGSEADFGQALDFNRMVIQVDSPIEDATAMPTQGNRAWAALVTIQNNRSEQVMYNLLDYHFIDVAGANYECTGATGKQMLGTGALAPGAQTQGYIVGQLPSAVEPVQVRFKPYVPAEKWDAIWR
jgi:hypothetical protein